ncbi:MAG: adenylate/guanylate cyclase domain-containing protein [Alphaproteobacteria bacterium]|nr:adenylate/guanylate cyclase domain-containing protein [Alphaproteobacteria bacterium SS10]
MAERGGFFIAAGRFIKKRRLELILPILLAFLPVWERGYSDSAGIMDRLTRLNFDFYLRAMPREPDPEWPVKIIDIDEKALAKVGQWPWSRAVMAELVDRLTELDAKVIVFDMVFAEPDRLSPQRMLSQLASFDGSVDTENLAAVVAGLPDNDEQFGEAIKASRRVVAGITLDSEGGKIPAHQDKRGGVRFDNATVAAGGQRNDDLGIWRLQRATNGIVKNLDVIEQAARGTGHFNMNPGVDGLVRRIPMIHAFHPESEAGMISGEGGLYYPGLSLQALRIGEGGRRGRIIANIFEDPNHRRTISFGDQGQEQQVTLNNLGYLSAKVGEHEISLLERGEMIVYFAGHLGPKPDDAGKNYKEQRYVSAAHILDGSVDPEKIAGKYAFIGTSAAGLKDLRSTPLNALIAGVEVHVEALEQILQGKFITRPAEIQLLEWAGAMLLGIGAVLLLQVAGSIISGVIALSTAAGIYGGSVMAFKNELLFVDPIMPITALTLSYLSALALNLWRTQSEKAELRGAFGLYLSPELVDELSENPERLKLGGEMRELTILFSDIRGFTSISEQYDPESLTKLINAFLTPMTASVLEKRGTIDKYMGDALMAFWNAPLDVDEHAKQACRSAIEMTALLGPLNVELERQAKEAGRKFIPLNAGIGMNTGPCSVGNMGSEQRFAYSVLGDAVNLAARLEGQTKSYGMAMIVGETTKEQIDGFATIELDLIRVKGKLQPVTIYGLLGAEAEGADPAFQQLNKTVDDMLIAYRSQNWDGALTLLDQMKSEAEALGERLPRGTNIQVLYDLYAERISSYRAEPPGDDWDGVFVATTK